MVQTTERKSVPRRGTLTARAYALSRDIEAESTRIDPAQSTDRIFGVGANSIR